MSEKMNCLNKKFIETLNGLVTTEEKASHERVKPKIQRVSTLMRGQKYKDNSDSDSSPEKYYDPMWMSIGPIHHGDQKFELGERYKLSLAAKFIREGGYKSWEELCEKINKPAMEKIVKECFSDEIAHEYENRGECLNSILLFDGCAILQFIHSSRSEEGYKELKEMKIKNDLIAYSLHDLFLLENQIPYGVLKLLIETRSIGKQNDLKESIRVFIIGKIMAPERYQRKLQESWKNPFDPEPAHLLDLLLSALLHSADPKQKSSTTTDSASATKEPATVSDPEKQDSSSTGQTQSNDLSRTKKWASDILRACNRCWRERKEAKEQQTFRLELKAREHQTFDLVCRERKEAKEQQTFRSVKDLQAAGINLKPSKTSSLGDIKFSSLRFAGTLKLPPLLVDDSTASKFMNLIAYEMCPDNIETEYEVTSYICFLDSLIDYAADVKELRSARILHNRMGCDKEVAQLFNKIAKDLVPNPNVNAKVIEDIESHYKKKYMTWMAQVFNDHFSSPWTIVAFMAAVLAIGMTAIQTWFAVYSPEGPCDNFCQHLKKL